MHAPGPAAAARARRGSRATLVVRRLPLDDWHEVVGDAILADAILDRLVHHVGIRKPDAVIRGTWLKRRGYLVLHGFRDPRLLPIALSLIVT